VAGNSGNCPSALDSSVSKQACFEKRAFDKKQKPSQKQVLDCLRRDFLRLLPLIARVP
jgi:hypothetical protein